MIDPRRPDFSLTPADARRPRFDYALRDGSPSAPLVSIVTPFHDDGPEFHETAACILGQSLQRFEWIVVNDASTKAESLAILDKYRHGKRDARIRVIDHDGNRGPGAARNTGVRAARSEMIFQLDSDDLIEPTTLEKCLWFLQTHPKCAFVKGYSVAFGAKEHLWDKTFRANERFLDHNCTTITTMLRREVFRCVGGYDEDIRHGMEDWEFWLKCAAAGLWGDAIPEHLDWYRRRPCHSDVWHDWDGNERQKAFRERLREKYVPLLKGRWPSVKPTALRPPCAPARREVPVGNPLGKKRPRLLMVLPWMRMGGADKFNLDLVEQLTRRGWEVTIATTTGEINGWMPEFARFTPDIFVLPSLVPAEDMPVMLRGLIESRRPDVVMLSNSEAAYEWLPYLRATCPEPAFIDYNHMEEEYWKSGGHPRSGAGAQPLLDLNITASEHLKAWMISRGADAARIDVCTINVDPEVWKPDAVTRTRVRSELGIPQDETVILYAGRICAQKQPEVFARTMGELTRASRADGLTFRALVAGDGELRPTLEKSLEANGAAERVTLLGEVDSARMRELMAAADIFFLPSRWEGIALVIYEAMASGAVVVGAQVGGQLELVTPDAGVLLPKASPGREVDEESPAYARALLALVRDPSRRQMMAQAARARIQTHFTLDEMGSRMHDLLQQAMRMHTQSPRPMIDARIADELLDRALESQRLARVADRMWGENRKLREQLQAMRKERDAAVANALPSAQPLAANKAPARPAPAGAPGKPARPPNGRPALHANGHNGRHNGAARQRPSGTNGVYRNGAHRPSADDLAAIELQQIENSKAWRLVTAFKSNPLYALMARMRWGREWRRQALVLSPAQRLEFVRASRAYRFILRAKKSGLYNWYAKRKHAHSRGVPSPDPNAVEPKPRKPAAPDAPPVDVVARRDELATRR